jgi:hypothetical protein
MDSASLRLTEAVATRGRGICLFVTSREGPPQGALSEHPRLVEIPLRPLSADEQRRFVEQELGSASVESAVVDLVRRYAGGNPLAAQECLHFFREGRQIIEDGGSYRAGSEAIDVRPAHVERSERVSQGPSTPVSA